jgi:hypothetical protein
MYLEAYRVPQLYHLPELPTPQSSFLTRTTTRTYRVKMCNSFQSQGRMCWIDNERTSVVKDAPKDGGSQ